MIVAKTIIGKGSPGRAGTEKAHGEALGEAEVKATRAALGWQYEPFTVPDDVYAAWDAKRAGAARESKWKQLFDAYSERYPREAGEFERRTKGELPAAYFAARDSAIAAAAQKGESVATRKASQLALEAIAPALPELIGGSADLTGSNLTKWSKAGRVSPRCARRSPHQLRSARVRHVRDLERARGARRMGTFRRYVFDVLGLRA